MQSDSNPTTQKPIDLEHLRRFTLGDPDLEQEILTLFIDQAPKTLASLAEAESEQQWRAAAHGLKGSAKAIGAHHVADLAAEAERGFPDQATRKAEVAAVRAALEAVRDYIAQLRGPFAPGEA